MARSAQSRLFDNIGRRIRHLNADLKTETDSFRKAGLERHKENLENYREKLRQLASKNEGGKLTLDQLYEAADELLNNDKYTTDKKKIDKITRKMISEEDEDIFEEFKDIDFDDLFADFARLSGEYIGQSGDTGLRVKANNLIGKIEMYKDMGFLDEDQIATLNRLTDAIQTAYDAKGAKGVAYPIGKKGR